MDTDLIFIAFLVVFTLALAFTLFSRGRRDRRMVSAHRTAAQSAPGAEGRSEPDHDQGEHAPVQHGTQ